MKRLPKSGSKQHWVVCSLAAGVLLSAAWLVASAWLRTATRGLSPVPLKDVIAKSLDGWEVTELPLGPTESVSEASLEALRFDDYVYRRFTRGRIGFSVYASYWAPEKMAVGEVAKHTPDVCWVQNGIPRLAWEHRVTCTLGTRVLKPGEVRLFGGKGKPTHVIYWHIVNGQVLDHSQRFGWSLQGLRYWVDSFKRLWATGRAEQYIIRIDSTIPIPELMRETAFSSALGKLESILEKTAPANGGGGTGPI